MRYIMLVTLLIPVIGNATAPKPPTELTVKQLTRTECRKLKRKYSTDTMKVVIPACVVLGFDKYEVPK